MRKLFLRFIVIVWVVVLVSLMVFDPNIKANQERPVDALKIWQVKAQTIPVSGAYAPNLIIVYKFQVGKTMMCKAVFNGSHTEEWISLDEVPCE